MSSKTETDQNNLNQNGRENFIPIEPLKYDINELKEYAVKHHPYEEEMLQYLESAAKMADEREEDERNRRLLQKIFGHLNKSPVKCYHFVNTFFSKIHQQMDLENPEYEVVKRLERDFKNKAEFAYRNHRDVLEIQRILDTHIHRFLNLQSGSLIPTEKNLLPLLVTSWTKIDYKMFHPKTADRIRMITHSYFIRDMRNKVNDTLITLTNRVLEFWKAELTAPEDEWDNFERTVTTEEVGIWIITENWVHLYPKLI